MLRKFKFSPPPAWFYSDILLVLFASVILCYLAFYNGFPFFYSDSGTYMWTAFSDYAPIDRPLFYGVFLKHASLMTSLWLDVFAQALCVAIPLYLCFKYFAGTKKYRIYFIIYVFLITFFTGASINVGQLIPDVFTSVMLLCIALFLFAPRMKILEMILISFIFVLSVGFHNSHFIIGTLVLSIFLVAFTIRKLRRILQSANMKLWRMGYVFLLLISSYMIVSTIHYNAGLKFAVSRYGHVFFMARLHDCGILEQYLHENCKKYHYHLCDDKTCAHCDFIWDYNNSPLYKNGGWEGNRDEFNAIIRDILTTPKYWPRLIARETEATFKQFFTFQAGDTGKQDDESSVVTAIKHHWPENLKEFSQSKQQKQWLGWGILNIFQTYLMALLFLTSALAFMLPGIKPIFKLYLIYFLTVLVVNAFVCGAISGVIDRYQARVIWLLPLPFMLYIANTEYCPKRLMKWFKGVSN